MTNKEKEFVTAIRAMDFLARRCNDEDITIDEWLVNGVPDGDITEEISDEEILNLYDEKEFKWFIGSFLRCMKEACPDGLYIAGITGREKD